VYSIAINADKIFIGTAGGVFMSNNSGESWTVVNHGLTGTLQVFGITIKNDKIFAATLDGLFLSTNNGSSWTLLNNGLDPYVKTIAISGNNIFAGKWGGVFLSSDKGLSWSEENDGLSGNGLYVSSLAVSDSYIFAGTGNGIWKRLLSDFKTNIDIVDSSSIRIYPNPAKDYLTVSIGNCSDTQEYSIRIVNLLGKIVFETKVTQPQYQINTSRLLGKGVYILRVSDSNNIIKATKKIIFL